MTQTHEVPSQASTGRTVAWMVAALAGASFLQWTGSSAVLPLLPIYLAEQGNSSALIGTIMASFFAAAVVAQFSAGRLGDRIGHRPILIAGLLIYAVASFGFALSPNAWAYLGLRVLQGLGAGAAQVASLALVARVVPPSYRGRAFAAISGAELAGVAIGPLLGIAFGIGHMDTLFIGSALMAVLACLPVLASRATQVDVAPLAVDSSITLPRKGIARRALIGALLVGVIAGSLTGTYEACWSLLMNYRGATPNQIGWSWTLFALPYLLVMPIAGWLADTWDRRVLVAFGLVVAAVMAAVYPFLPSPTWMMMLGMVESCSFAFALPAAQSMLTQLVPVEVIGRVQGLYVGLNTTCIAVAAAVAGALFDLGPWIPFVVTSVLGLSLTVVLVGVWRNVPGRVTAATQPEVVPAA